MKTTLKSIIDKYSKIEYNSNNYGVGGGLSRFSYVSRRHEDAKEDIGKLTLGAATKLFVKATGLTTEVVKETLIYAIPNMEWHHAGFIPKDFGGGMRKTYFLNSSEICDVAKNWNDLVEKLEISKEAEKRANEAQLSIEERKLEFLKENATKAVRVSVRPEYFYETAREMNGKYGWFDSTYKSYNLPEYYSGWVFENKQKWLEFFEIK